MIDLQQFNCCGYMNIPFHQGAACADAIAAAKKSNCVGPISNFANSFLDVVFTAMFGIVGRSYTCL